MYSEFISLNSEVDLLSSSSSDGMTTRCGFGDPVFEPGACMFRSPSWGTTVLCLWSPRKPTAVPNQEKEKIAKLISFLVKNGGQLPLQHMPKQKLRLNQPYVAPCLGGFFENMLQVPHLRTLRKYSLSFKYFSIFPFP